MSLLAHAVEHMYMEYDKLAQPLIMFYSKRSPVMSARTLLQSQREPADKQEHSPVWPSTVKSLCDDCFGYQEICPYIELSLLRGTTAVRMQCLVTKGVVFTSQLSLHRVSLQGEFNVLERPA